MDNEPKNPHKKDRNDLAIWRIARRTGRFIRFSCYSSIVCLLLMGLTYLVLKSRPLPIPDNYAISQIYDAKNHYIGQTEVGQPLEHVKLSDIPVSLVQATLAAEDKNFYHHHGFSLKGIARAIRANTRAGGIVQGASTITQQLAKNLYLSHDRTWTRKVKEALLTLQLEIHYTKQQILEMYFNNIYYGHGCFGIGRAAHVYFNKKADQLTLAESAFLAGIPRGPTYYSPYFHKERATHRQQDILDLMVRNQAIAESATQQARLQKISIQPPMEPNKVTHHYFRDYIIQTAVTRYGLDEALVRHGGFKIYTTLDPALQQAAEETVAHCLKNRKGLQGALISVDPKTGFIKAMVGGKDYNHSQFNRVFAKRQPGSTFKPFLYLSALENGFTPLTKIMSQPTSFSFEGKSYSPKNFANRYAHKPISLREAIARSDNIYAVTAQSQIGFEDEIKTAHKLGINSPLQPTPSLALGSYPISAFELSQAYATIAAGGIQHPLIGIRKIVDPYGRVIVEEKPEALKVASPEHTYVLTQLLTSVFQRGGTAQRLQRIVPAPVAGKTGSTDWDSWLAGFTPNLVTTVWIGYDHDKKIRHAESILSQSIWGKYMKRALQHVPSDGFQMPPGVRSVQVDPHTGYLATSNCPNRRTEYFVAGTEPQIICPDHPETNRSMLHRFIKWIKE